VRLRRRLTYNISNTYGRYFYCLRRLNTQSRAAEYSRCESALGCNRVLVGSLGSPAQPSPAQPSPAQPSPAQPSPAQPSPAQPRGIPHGRDRRLLRGSTRRSILRQCVQHGRSHCMRARIDPAARIRSVAHTEDCAMQCNAMQCNAVHSLPTCVTRASGRLYVSHSGHCATTQRGS
jgi:hypothetical protein